MEAQPVRETLPFAQATLPVQDDDFDWVYADPDLVPFLAGKDRRRKETPLSAFV